MEKITSFTVNHLSLEPDVYVSRKDVVDPETVATLDLRMTASNKEPVMNIARVHTPEHLDATLLRNHADFGTRVLYFGPVSCCTGFCLLLCGDYEPVDILSLFRELFHFVTGFMGEVPGTAACNCGNYLDMNLPMAKWEIRRYLEHALDAPRPSQLRHLDQEKLRL